MLTHYVIGETYDFEVIRDVDEHEDFFRLDIPGRGEAYLPKLKFQQEEALPISLKCRVKYINNGMPVLAHFTPYYVNRFYRQGVAAGSEYEFTVVALPGHPGDKFSLEDRYGIRYNLPDTGALLTVGQKVICRFTRIADKFFNLEQSDSDVRFQLYTPAAFLELIGVRGILRDVLIRAILDMPEVRAELDAKSPAWVITALKGSLSALSEWFERSDLRRHNAFFGEVVRIIRQAGLYILEDSRILRNMAEQPRRSLQTILTEVVEGVDPFRSILSLVAEGAERTFADSMINKLRESGYLYHPARQFSILMTIFRSEPHLVQDYLGRIFDAIMEWKLETWTTEPFRSAFAGQFEIYIRQTCREIDLLPQADTQADVDRIEKIVIAIALQMLIANDPDSDRYRHNRALFYRYISLLRPVRSADLLDKAFLTTLGVRLPLEFGYDTIKEPQMLMTRATVTVNDELRLLQSIHHYHNRGVLLRIDQDGLLLSRSDAPQAGRLIPNGMMEWLSPQVLLDGINSLNGSQLNNLEAHRRLWTNIENALFEERRQDVTTDAPRRPEPGDRVLITIYEKETAKSDNPRWVAMVDDEQFTPVTGYIMRDDIVSFTLRSQDLDRNREVAASAFIDDDGRPRHFYATVKAIDAGGAYHFSLLDDVAEQCSDLLSYNQEYIAVIAQCHQREYSAISELGYGVYLSSSTGDTSDYAPGDVVRFVVFDRTNSNHIIGTITKDAGEDEGCDKVTAFANLMAAISVTPEGKTEETELILDADETLSREDVTEITQLIRFKAISSQSMLEAYDYLQLARLLALMIDDANLAERLQIHADLLRMHQFYATNRRIDADELEQYRSRVAGYPLLEVVFHRLEIVSWLGDTDRNNDLWETVTAQRNLLESNLARLVLSYNMLPDSADDTQTAVNEGLKSKIARMLGVNFEARHLKSYGRENQFIEFKSSIVYPARKFKHEKVKADPERQQFVILKIIASFLNSSGGTLYIGVNDLTRCEAGLFEDFEFYKHHRASIGTFQYAINSADNVCVYLQNLVRFRWGNLVAESITISEDTEATREVVVVKVAPRTKPVLLDDRIYVRRSSSTIVLNDAEAAEFIREREELELLAKAEARAAQAAELSAATFSSETAAPTEPSDTSDSSDSADTSDISDNTGHAIPTSAWRNNALHDWDPGYVTPAGYFYFNDNGSITRCTTDRQYDYNDDCRLALSFTHDELRQGYLLIVYRSQKVSKIPMSEILEKDLDRPFNFNTESEPIFATIAQPGDCLLLHMVDSKNSVYRRVVPLAELASVHLTSSPALITDAPGIADIIACEIVDSSALDAFGGSMNRDMSTRQIGYPLRTQRGTEKAQQILDDDRTKSAPKQ